MERAGHDIRQNVQKAIREAAEDGLSIAQSNIDDMELHGATGWLRLSGYVAHEEERSQFGFTARYAPDVNDGTMPHEVNLKDLTKWARIKFGLSKRKAEQVAYEVQAHIRQHGTRAKPFFTEAFEVVQQQLPDLVNAHLKSVKTDVTKA